MTQSARQSSPEPEIEHRRIAYPMPSGAVWKVGCSCGWEGQEPLHVRQASDLQGITDALDRRFVEHLPAEARETYVLVDQREGHEGNFIMPVGRSCCIESHFESDGVRYARLAKPDEMVLPVGEIRTADGKVFRLG